MVMDWQPGRGQATGSSGVSLKTAARGSTSEGLAARSRFSGIACCGMMASALARLRMSAMKYSGMGPFSVVGRRYAGVIMAGRKRGLPGGQVHDLLVIFGKHVVDAIMRDGRKQVEHRVILLIGDRRRDVLGQKSRG